MLLSFTGILKSSAAVLVYSRIMLPSQERIFWILRSGFDLKDPSTGLASTLRRSFFSLYNSSTKLATNLRDDVLLLVSLFLDYKVLTEFVLLQKGNSGHEHLISLYELWFHNK